MALGASSFPSCDLISVSVIIVIACWEGSLLKECFLYYFILGLFGYKQMNTVLSVCFSLVFFPPLFSQVEVAWVVFFNNKLV